MTKWLIPETTNVKGGKIEYRIPEKPLLHCCCNVDKFADMNIDIRTEVKPDVVADITKGIPFPDNSFQAAFADFPWINKWKWESARAIKQMLRVAPIVYTISPWLYGAKTCYPDKIKISWRPGINAPILFVRYVRKQMPVWEDKK